MIMIRVALTIAATLVASACGGSVQQHETCETRVPVIMDSPIEELSADEIVAMVVEATREVHSLLRESRATVEWRTYERSTSVVWMHVAGDYYSSWTFPESADSPLEMLVYRGNVWKRDDAGGWVSDKPPSDRPVDTHSTDLSRSSIRDDQRMGSLLVWISRSRLAILSGSRTSVTEMA